MKPFELVKLHPDVLSVPFQHRKELSAKFRDVLGLLELDYISIEIVNPDEEFLFFASTPTVNFNIISNHLWPYDGAMSPTFYKKQHFFSWEAAYQPLFLTKLKKLKEAAHGFSYGFCLVRRVAGFTLIYSFATKNKNKKIPDFFEERRLEVLKIGDFCYKWVRPIYALYAKNHTPPLVTQFISEVGENRAMHAAHLKLVVNNT